MTTTTETVIPTARPAGLSNQCHEYMRNPLILQGSTLPEDGPLLVQCKEQASRRLVLQNCGDTYTVKFCQHHYERLKEQIEAGRSLVEILEEQELEARR